MSNKMSSEYAPPQGMSVAEHTKLIEDILSILSNVQHIEKRGAPVTAAGKQAIQEVLNIVPGNIKQMALSSVPAGKGVSRSRRVSSRTGRTIPSPVNKNSNINYSPDPTRSGIKPFPGDPMSGKKS